MYPYCSESWPYGDAGGGSGDEGRSPAGGWPNDVRLCCGDDAHGLAPPGYASSLVE